MKLLKQILILSLITWGFMACDRESALTPSGPENVYGDPTLPQGNHDYDNTIMDWFKKYNTLFLYKYVPHDLYYGGNSYLGGTYDPVKDTTAAGTNAQNYTGYFDVPADEDYVGFQLKLLNDTWLKFYSDEFLLKFYRKKFFCWIVYIGVTVKRDDLTLIGVRRGREVTLLLSPEGESGL